MKTYSELSTIGSYRERFEYLRLDGVVGAETFGWERYLNQQFYRSDIWLKARDLVIARDEGFDMGHRDVPIVGAIFVHHINPIRPSDVLDVSQLVDPENLISVSFITHQAIHYGDESLIFTGLTERTRNDTCPWRKEH